MSNSHCRIPNLRQITPAVEGRSITIGARRKNKRTNERTEIKGSRTPRDAVPQPPHLSMRRAACNPRSPLGVPLRLSPRGLSSPKAQRQAMLSGTVRSTRSYGPPTGAKTVCFSTGVTRAETCPSPASTSRAGRNAGRMIPKPPGSKGDEPKPAGTATRSAGKGHWPASS
jgi:hypothetical protein